MPAEPGTAFVVVMHLSPDHESSLAAILQRAGKMPVVSVAGLTPIEVNQVYVISPAVKLAMSDGHLRVSPRVTLEGRRHSIDLFFRSLAQAHQARAVCVVLSGTGSDGSRGLKRIKELGGVAIAQSPEDAEFDGMPRAAALTGLIDFILPVDEMPDKLALLWENARRIELPRPPGNLVVERSEGEAEVLAEEALLSIKAMLRERTGHDFAHYKRGAVLRRLERRMQVNALPDLPSYRRLLDPEPKRDTGAAAGHAHQRNQFLPRSRGRRGTRSRPRIDPRRAPGRRTLSARVAGCATGEEAGSVAIVLRKLSGPNAPQSQVFAADIAQRAVAFARAGLFTASIATEPMSEAVRRYERSR